MFGSISTELAPFGLFGSPDDRRTKSARRLAELRAELIGKFDDEDEVSLSDSVRVDAAAALILKHEKLIEAAASGRPYDAEELANVAKLATEAIREATPARGLMALSLA